MRRFRRRPLCLVLAAAIFTASSRPAYADGDDAAQGQVTKLSDATMQAGLIAVTTLHTETRQPGIPAYGRVVDPTPVVRMQAAIAAAQARAGIAHATLARTRHLFHAAQNVSKARLEQAQANDAEARAHLDGLTAEARLRYGAALGAAIVGDGAAFRRIASGGALVSVIVPAGSHAAGSGAAHAWAPDGHSVALTRVGRAGTLPTGVVGTPLYFTGPALPSGMPLAVTLPGGKPATGYDVPVSALVWRRDVPRLFLRVGTREFREVRLPQATPIRHDGAVVGYFVPKSTLSPSGVAASPAIVTKGAGLVLSAQSGSSSGGGDGDDGGD